MAKKVGTFSYVEINNDVYKSLRKEKYFLHGLIILKQKGYIDYEVIDGKPNNIGMSKTGLDAVADLEFRKKQSTAIFNASRDIIVVFTGLVVAIATVYALTTKDEVHIVLPDMQELREELIEQKEVLTNQAVLIRNLQDSIKKK